MFEYHVQILLTLHCDISQGYALIEFENYEDALAAIKGLNGKNILDQSVCVNWAFAKK